MSDITRTPIAIFTYNRPDHTIRMLDTLGSCMRLSECDVFIFSDGPRLSEHTAAVQNVREIICERGEKHNAKIIEQISDLIADYYIGFPAANRVTILVRA